MNDAATLKVTLVRSRAWAAAATSRPRCAASACAASIRACVVKDTPQNRGMIETAKHMVKVDRQ